MKLRLPHSFYNTISYIGAAIATIASIGPAERDELLAPESHAAVATVAGADGDFDFIDEFHGEEPGMGNGESGMGVKRSVTGCGKDDGAMAWEGSFRFSIPHSRPTKNPAAAGFSVGPQGPIRPRRR